MYDQINYNNMNFNNMNPNPMMNSNNNMGMNQNPMMNINNNMGMGMNPMMNNNMGMGMGMSTMMMNPNQMNLMLMSNMINQVNQNFILINNEMTKLAKQRMANNKPQPMNNTQNSNNKELPRTQESVNYDPFAGYNGPRYNVKCITPAGHTVVMNAPVDATVYSLLRQYIAKIQLGPNVINNGIYFISNGKKISNEDMNKKVGSIFYDNTNIIVIDQKGLIGG